MSTAFIPDDPFVEDLKARIASGEAPVAEVTEHECGEVGAALMENEPELPPVPDGFVRTKGGEIIKRDKALFIRPKIGTVEDPNGKVLDVFSSVDGRTRYAERPDGSMLRIDGKEKLTKAEKKAKKRAKFAK